jgi:hypothetical protein
MHIPFTSIALLSFIANATSFPISEVCVSGQIKFIPLIKIMKLDKSNIIAPEPIFDGAAVKTVDYTTFSGGPLE